ncbi:MAG: hypothetical protein KDI15_06245 [Thiothrix sp.]|nr:hypothetical protein [Thiothrix sp.]
MKLFIKPFIPLLAILLLAGLHGNAHATSDNSCQGQVLQKTFSSGANWRFCWDIRDQEGLVLSQVYYQAPGNIQRRVLGEAALSQIEAEFDDGAIDPVFITTTLGLGGDRLQTRNAEDCPGGQIQNHNGRPVLCTLTRAAGYLYKYTTQRQTEAFEISTLSSVGPRTYIQRWRFLENGTMEPAIGLSGVLPAVNESPIDYGWPVTASGAIATGLTDHYLWRLDFDLDENAANDVIEEITSTPSYNRLTKIKAINTIQTETGRSLDPETKRFWRIRDSSIRNGHGNYISYELVPTHYDQSRANSRDESWLSEDVYFSRYQACERFAADNDRTCGRNVTAFINNNQNLNQEDVVVWYKINNHILPRSEDSNRMAVRWSSFKLLPRDWHTQNPF